MSDSNQKLSARSQALIKKYFLDPEAEKLKQARECPEGLFLAGKVVHIEQNQRVSEVDGVTVHKVQTSVEIIAAGQKFQFTNWANLNEEQIPIELETDHYYVFIVGGLKTHRVTDGKYEDRKTGKERDNVVTELTEVRWLDVSEYAITPKAHGGSQASSSGSGAAAPRSKPGAAA